MAGNDGLFAWVAIAAIVAFALTIIIISAMYNPYASRYRSFNSTASYIAVTATGSVSATPEQASLYITANGTAKSAANATAMLSKTVYAVDSALSGYLANGSSIQTTSYQLYVPYNSSYYTASEGITLTLPLNSTGSAIDALSKVSGTFINGVSIQLSQSQVSGMGSMALAIAMQNASMQAQQVAGPTTALKISSVTINSAGYIFPGPRFAVSENTVPFFPGTQSVTQSVTVKYAYAG